jgi:hypothetical protein
MLLDDPCCPRLFDVGVGSLCPACPALPVCDLARTDHACTPRWGSDRVGGEHVLHPAKADTPAFFKAVDGPGFSTVRALPFPRLEVPPYLPQIRMRRGLRGFLDESIYGVRAGVVIRSNSVLAASALKSHVGLPIQAKIVLLLFDADAVIERLYRNAKTMLPVLANAGYDLVVAPSYSCWWPRPRTDHIYNLKRSLWVFGALQKYGIPAVPRVAWGAREDVKRFAAWVQDNTSLDTVGVDLMTYRTTRWWQGQMDGLRLFDHDTGKHLRYLVNGPSELQRFIDIYDAIAPERTTVTNLAIARPPRGRASGTEHWPSIGRQFREEIARDRSLLALARKKVSSVAGPSVPREDEAA